jgi:CIC family chloride channel protein
MRRYTSLHRFILSVVAIGLLSGLGATGFHFLADSFGEWIFELADSQTARTRLPFVLVAPTVGLFLVGLVLHRYPESRLGGVREVLDALERAGGAIPMRRIVNVILSAFVLAFGGSVGPEGPMVQLGALAGSQTGRRFGFDGRSLQMMVRAGAAAGIAAAFRSPAGGVLLTLELFGARFNRELTAIAAAAGLGYVTRTALLGDAYPFRPPGAISPLPLTSLLFVVPVMGILAAPLGHFFIRMFARAREVLPAGWPLPLRVMLGGLLVGVIGIWFPEVLSAGYPVILKALRSGMGYELLALLMLLKMVATSITFGTGAVGGLFAPTLVIGAMYGGAFGFGLHALVPELVPSPELFVLLGMVVMFGSIIKGYWSGLLMVADLSGCYHELLVPGIVAGGISFLASWELHDESIFGLRLEREPAAPDQG